MNCFAPRLLVLLGVFGNVAHVHAQQIFGNGFEAATLYAYDFGNKHLVSFRADAPATLLSDVALSGLGVGENLTGIDFRPANGLLYAVASTGTVARVVSINASMGAVTPVSAVSFAAPSGFFFGLDFNPTVDRIRYVSDLDINHRINPDDGALILPDADLAYLVGDPNAAVNPSVVHAAYTGDATPTTTLYAIDSTTDALVRIGGVGGSPSPNSGALTTIGALGVSIASAGGFDIQKYATSGYAALRVSGVSSLYVIDLSTGAATLVGAIGPVGSALTIDGLAIAP